MPTRYFVWVFFGTFSPFVVVAGKLAVVGVSFQDFGLPFWYFFMRFVAMRVYYREQLLGPVPDFDDFYVPFRYFEGVVLVVVGVPGATMYVYLLVPLSYFHVVFSRALSGSVGEPCVPAYFL